MSLLGGSQKRIKQSFLKNGNKKIVEHWGAIVYRTKKNWNKIKILTVGCEWKTMAKQIELIKRKKKRVENVEMRRLELTSLISQGEWSCIIIDIASLFLIRISLIALSVVSVGSVGGVGAARPATFWKWIGNVLLLSLVILPFGFLFSIRLVGPYSSG